MKCVIKRRLKFEDYKKYLQNNEIILISQEWFKSEANNLITEEVNKIALSFSPSPSIQNINNHHSIYYIIKKKMMLLKKIIYMLGIHINQSINF